jgi:hypothetical protein
MGKMCSFARHTTFLLSVIASLECKVVKNAKQCAGSLFTGAEIFVKFPCELWTICWSNHPRAFVSLVEGELLSNFRIQRLMHFGFENWRKVESKMVKSNCVWTRAHPRTTSPARPPRRLAVPGLRAHTEASENPAVRGPRRRHCAARAHDAHAKPRPVPRGLRALAGGRTAIRHWPPVRRTSPPPPHPCLSSCRPRRYVATASTRPGAIKPPASFSSRSRATRRRPPLAPLVTSLLRSRSGKQWPKSCP